MNIRALLMVLLLAPAIPSGASAAHYVVTMANLKFGPVPANLKVGDTIEWQNTDMFRHTATAKGQFDADLKPGAKQTVSLGKTGIVSVICRFHPTMTAKLTVAKK